MSHQERDAVDSLNGAGPEQSDAEQHTEDETPSEPGIQRDGACASYEKSGTQQDIPFGGRAAVVFVVDLIVGESPDRFSSVVKDAAAQRRRGRDIFLAVALRARERVEDQRGVVSHDHCFDVETEHGVLGFGHRRPPVTGLGHFTGSLLGEDQPVVYCTSQRE